MPVSWRALFVPSRPFTEERYLRVFYAQLHVTSPSNLFALTLAFSTCYGAYEQVPRSVAGGKGGNERRNRFRFADEFELASQPSGRLSLLRV